MVRVRMPTYGSISISCDVAGAIDYTEYIRIMIKLIASGSI